MKLVADIAKYLFARNGQYIVGGGTLQSVRLKVDDFYIVMDKEIKDFEKYAPFTRDFNINMYGSPFRYDFTRDNHNNGFIPQNSPPTITSHGVAGIYQYSYFVAAYNAKKVLIKTTGQGFIQTGNETLDTSNYNVLTWDAVPSADKYEIYRISTLGNPTTTGLIGSVAGNTTTFHDTGIVGDQRMSRDYPNTYGISPFMLSSEVPVGTFQIITNIAYLMNPSVRSYANPSRLVDPRVFVAKFADQDADKPGLFTTETGRFDITAHYRYQRIENYSADGNLEEVEYPRLEDNTREKILMDILSAVFLQAIGRGRRAFTYQDLPIKDDSEKLVAEGLEQYEAARKELYQRMDWGISVRP